MNMQTVYYESMDKVASQVLEKKPQLIALSGPLGAGKTTLVQHILRQLGVTEPIQSPTYAYLTRYTLPNEFMIYHFDLYRLRNLQDFVDAGFEEYLFQENSLCLIEWPEIIKPFFIEKSNVCALSLAYDGTDKRTITFE